MTRAMWAPRWQRMTIKCRNKTRDLFVKEKRVTIDGDIAMIDKVPNKIKTSEMHLSYSDSIYSLN